MSRLIMTLLNSVKSLTCKAFLTPAGRRQCSHRFWSCRPSPPGSCDTTSPWSTEHSSSHVLSHATPADLRGGPRSVWKNVARQRGADWAEVTEPKRLCFFFLPPLHLKDASDNLRVCGKLYFFLKMSKACDLFCYSCFGNCWWKGI